MVQKPMYKCRLNRTRRRLIGAGYGVILGLWITPALLPVHADNFQVGDVAPNWMLMDTSGQSVLLYDQADKGKATVMFFWASWCKQCRNLLPKLQNFADQITADPQSPESIAVFALNIWEDKDPVKYFASLDLNLTLLPKAESVAERYGIAGTPSIIVVDSNKKIIFQESGPLGDIGAKISALPLH
jgi:thiol-disulfide isomerase/thioredoxin